MTNGINTKQNPSVFDPLPEMAPDEPFFRLRASDRLAPNLIRTWAAQQAELISLGKAPPADALKVSEAYQIATRMELWYRDHKRAGTLPEQAQPKYTQFITAEWHIGDQVKCILRKDKTHNLVLGGSYEIRDLTDSEIMIDSPHGDWFPRDSFMKVA